MHAFRSAIGTTRYCSAHGRFRSPRTARQAAVRLVPDRISIFPPCYTAPPTTQYDVWPAINAARLDKTSPHEGSRPECRTHGRVHVESVASRKTVNSNTRDGPHRRCNGKAGIKVILGTPTYSIPAWMAHQHPEIFADRIPPGMFGRKACAECLRHSPEHRHRFARIPLLSPSA